MLQHFHTLSGLSTKTMECEPHFLTFHDAKARVSWLKQRRLRTFGTSKDLEKRKRAQFHGIQNLRTLSISGLNKISSLNSQPRFCCSHQGTGSERWHAHGFPRLSVRVTATFGSFSSPPSRGCKLLLFSAGRHDACGLSTAEPKLLSHGRFSRVPSSQACTTCSPAGGSC